MTKRFAKMGVLAVAGGSVFGLGSCLSEPGLYILRDAALYTAEEFLLDNDSVFDLFQDDYGTGTTYDDRNSADPTRSEP